jgi:hypothetical protein
LDGRHGRLTRGRAAVLRRGRLLRLCRSRSCCCSGSRLLALPCLLGRSFCLSSCFDPGLHPGPVDGRRSAESARDLHGGLEGASAVVPTGESTSDHPREGHQRDRHDSPEPARIESQAAQSIQAKPSMQIWGALADSARDSGCLVRRNERGQAAYEAIPRFDAERLRQSPVQLGARSMALLDSPDRRGTGADLRRELLLAPPEPRAFEGDQVAVDAAALADALQGWGEPTPRRGGAGRALAARRLLAGLAFVGCAALCLSHLSPQAGSFG